MESNISTCGDDHLSRRLVSSRHWSTPASLEASAPAVAAVYALICGLALALNLLVVVALLCRRRCSLLPSLILFINLHAAGLLMALVVMPLVVVAVSAKEFPFGSDDFTRCQVCYYSVALVTLSGVSLHSLAAIAVDRAVFVWVPRSYERLVSPLCTAVATSVVWAVSIILAVLPVLGYGLIDYNADLGACLPRYSTDRNSHSGYLHLLVADALLAASVLLVAGVCIVCRLRCQREGERGSEYLESQKKLLTVYFGTMVAVACTELPALTAAVITGILHHRGGLEAPEVALGAFICHLASFVLLPLATVILLPEPRATLKSLLRIPWGSIRVQRRSLPSDRSGDQPPADVAIHNHRVDYAVSSPWELEESSTFQPFPSPKVQRSLDILTTAINRARVFVDANDHLSQDGEVEKRTSSRDGNVAVQPGCQMDCAHDAAVYANQHTCSPAHSLPDNFSETSL